jgi:hypothetical protein
VGDALRIRLTLRQSIYRPIVVVVDLLIIIEVMDDEFDDKPKRTLLPRFSIRTLFWLITASAFVFVVVGMAARGHGWAWGVTIGLASILFTGLVHAAVFGAVWSFGQLVAARPKDVG